MATLHLAEGWRLSEDGQLQWILERHAGQRWVAKAWCGTKAGLLEVHPASWQKQSRWPSHPSLRASFAIEARLVSIEPKLLTSPLWSATATWVDDLCTSRPTNLIFSFMTRLLCMRPCAGRSDAILDSLHIVRRVAPD